VNVLADLREVIRRGDGSRLRRDTILRKIDRFELECKRVGADPNSKGQLEFCKLLSTDGKGEDADPHQWMWRMVAVRLLRGDYSDWTGWEYRNKWAVSSYDPRLPNKRWRLEPVKTLALLGEQGIGDEIMFSSCVPDVLGLSIRPVIECDPRLVAIFKRSFGCETKPREDIVNRGSNRYLTLKRDEEAFLPIGDLPRFFRKSRSAFVGTPFLHPLPAMVQKWAHLKGRTGIAYRGRRGRFSPGEFALENPVCLQYDAWPAETEGMEVPKIDLRRDVEDLFGICANLEKVVTVPQTIVHIAGSIGTKVEVIIPPRGSGRVKDQVNWRYGLERQMPWYKSVKVFQSMDEWKRAT
jgi:hypothetical protein